MSITSSQRSVSAIAFRGAAPFLCLLSSVSCASDITIAMQRVMPVA